jgi:hypothetical protein
MTDEHLMRLWADAHEGFSADFDRGILKLGHHLQGRGEKLRPIGQPYARRGCVTVPADREMSANARAALAGIVACLATTGMLLTLSLLFAADFSAHAASGAPIVAHAIVA